MDEKEKLRLKKAYEEMPEEELVEMLLEDKKAYGEGVYELVLEEARKRGIEKKVSEQKLEEARKRGVERKMAEQKKEASEKSFDFMDIVYGWFPIIGYPLALYNYARGNKKRAKFLAIYSTIGIVPFVILIFRG